MGLLCTPLTRSRTEIKSCAPRRFHKHSEVPVNLELSEGVIFLGTKVPQRTPASHKDARRS